MTEDLPLRPILVGAVLVALLALGVVYLRRFDLTIREPVVVIQPEAP